jgi:hypothetical protein
VREDQPEIRAQLLESLLQHRQAAIVRSKAIAEQNRLRFNETVEHDPLEIGDWVLVRNNGKKKFEFGWFGPYRVSRVTPLGTYQLVSPDGETKQDLVHRMRLKRATIDPDNPPTKFWQPQPDREDNDTDAVMTATGGDSFIGGENVSL